MDRVAFRRGPTRGIVGTVPADVVLAELERIRKNGGGELTAGAVVNDARPPDSRLHPLFEWDDAKAGEQFRENQARRVIRAIVIVREEQAPAPAYLNVKIVRDERAVRFYQHSDVIIDRPDEFVSAVRLLRRHVLNAEESLSAARRLGERSARSDVDLQKLVSIGEALATARAIAERIQ